MDQSESLGTHHLQYVLGKPVHGRTLCSAADMKTTRPGWLLPVLGTIPSMESGGRHSIAFLFFFLAFNCSRWHKRQLSKLLHLQVQVRAKV